jgi:hypothetical protein
MPNGRESTYSARPYVPVGHPNSGVICGRVGCRRHGFAWLTLEEERTYAQGERIFAMYTGAVKVQIQ